MADQYESDKFNEGVGLPEDEDIFELTDEISSSSEDDEEIIELTDIVETPAEGLERLAGSADRTAGPMVEEEPDETVELETDASVESEGGADVDEAFSIDYAIDEDIVMDPEHDDFVDSLGMRLEEESDTPKEYEAPLNELGGAPVSETMAVSAEQLEKALERVIERMLSEKIERILEAVIERSVTKELERLKGILMEDSSKSD